MTEAARLALWLESLQTVSQGMTLAAGAGLLAVLVGETVTQIWPRAGRWLPWLGVGMFYATLAALQHLVSTGFFA